MRHSVKNVSIIKNPWESPINQITVEITETELHLSFNGIEARAPAFLTRVEVDEKKVLLHELDFKSLLEAKRGNVYEIIFKDCHSGLKRVFKLPTEMSKNLFHFLTGRRRLGENCMDFVNAMLFGCGMSELHLIYLDSRKTEMISDESKLAIGQPVAIGRGVATDQLNHFAIYLGDGLYVSVMGDNNPLYITTLEQMKLIYGVSIGVKISPVFVAPSYNSYCKLQ